MSRLISLISRQLARSLPKTRLQTVARSYLSRYAPAIRRMCCGRLTPGVDWKWIQRILASIYRGLCIRGSATKGFCRYPWSVVWAFFESVRSAERWYCCSYDNQWCVAGRPFHKCWYLWSVWKSSCRKADWHSLGYDSYPNGFDCANPYVWLSDAVPEWARFSSFW